MSPLDSITAYKTYGVTPSTLRFSMYNIFYFPEDYKDCLYHYQATKIATKDFLDTMMSGMYGNYQVIYHKTDPTKLLRRQEHTTVKLSFRVADPVFNIPPTVLVMEVTS